MDAARDEGTMFGIKPAAQPPGRGQRQGIGGNCRPMPGCVTATRGNAGSCQSS